MCKKSLLFSILLLAACFLFQPQTAKAQSEDLLGDRIYLLNGGDRQIPFYLLDVNNGQWYPFQLNSGSGQTYKYAVRIWLKTVDKEPIVRDVELGTRYEIFWNSDWQRWDIRKMPAANQLRRRYFLGSNTVLQEFLYPEDFKSEKSNLSTYLGGVK